MNITLIWVSLFFGFPSTQPVDSVQIATRYCSNKFQFCAIYPASILTFRATLIQDNGIILKSEDGYTEVIIAAFPQPAEVDTKAIFLSSARKKVDFRERT